MSILATLFAADAGSHSLWDPANGWVPGPHGAFSTRSGEKIGPAKAMAISAYYACVRNLAEDVGKLPLKVYKRLARGKEALPDHPLWPILHDQPNQNMTAFALRSTVTAHALSWGNGYAEVTKDASGRVLDIYPLHPTRVVPKIDGDGAVVYDVRRDLYATDRVTADLMLHIPGLGGDGVTGYSVAKMGAESMGLTLAAQTFGAAFFGNGARMGGVLKHPATLKPEARDNLRESWAAMHAGPANTGKTAILEEGMEFSQMTIPPEDAQFLETRRFQVEEICRWFRMPPHKIQDLERATYSNIEHQAIEYVSDTLMPWLVRWEQEIQRKLLAPGGPYFAEHLVDALQRGDQAARAAYYNSLWQIGMLSQDEAREKENLNPLPNGVGEIYYVPLNMQRAQDAAAEPKPVPAAFGATSPAEGNEKAQREEEAAAEGNEKAQREEEAAAETRRQAARLSQMRIFLAVAQRMTRKAGHAVARARERFGSGADYAQWADEWYGSHLEQVAEAFEPVANAYLELLTFDMAPVARAVLLGRVLQSIGATLRAEGTSVATDAGALSALVIGIVDQEVRHAYAKSC